LDFYVTPLDLTCVVVLGHNWLTRYNPLIDWVLGSIQFRTPHELELPSRRALVEENSSYQTLSTPVTPHSEEPSPALRNNPLEQFEKSSLLSHPVPISVISAAAFIVARRQKGSQVFTLQPHSLDQVKEKAAEVSSPDLSQIPLDYHAYADVFNNSLSSKLAEHWPYDMKINLEEGTSPPLGLIYSLSETEMVALQKFLAENLKSGFIAPSRSPHGAPILFVKKKDGSLRLCVDYQRLNRVTKKDRYPLPLITDLLDAPAKAHVYTKLDMKHAYYLVRIAEGDEYKTTFRTKYGSFEWRVMPFGLMNAPAVFQQFVNDIFADMLDISVVLYLDDILIYSDNMEDHKKHVQEVLHRLRHHGLYCTLSKSEFHKDTVEFLEYVLSPNGLSMSEKKIRTILDWPVPRKVKDIQSFLGFANFYRRFIQGYSNITVPLTRLTRAKVPWNFDEKCMKAFEALKKAFTTAPILTHWIPNRPIMVETDASDYAIAAILSIQLDDSLYHPVAFLSRTLHKAELNYDIHDKELLAIFEAFTWWRHYLEGTSIPIDVVTDHKNLEYFSTTKILTRRQVRWSEYLSAFNLAVQFRPGKLGRKPDALTRRWDVYPKEGDNTYAQVNPHNFRPVFTQEQLTSSLRATYLEEPVLRASYIMDSSSLHEDIKSALQNDSYALEGMELAKSNSPSQWSLDSNGLLRYDDRIWVPDSDKLQLRVLQNCHNHILACHFGQNRTLERVRRLYTWPGVCAFVKDYIQSCITCKRNKAP
jgi:hypothetical protein